MKESDSLQPRMSNTSGQSELKEQQKGNASRMKYSTGQVNISEVHKQLSDIGRSPTLSSLLTMPGDTKEVKAEVDEYYGKQEERARNKAGNY